jgi:hypothetical protein
MLDLDYLKKRTVVLKAVIYSVSNKVWAVGRNYGKSCLDTGNPAKGGEFGSKSKFPRKRLA